MPTICKSISDQNWAEQMQAFFSNVIRMRAPDAYIHKMCLISLTEKLACIKLFNLFSRSNI